MAVFPSFTICTRVLFEKEEAGRIDAAYRLGSSDGVNTRLCAESPPRNATFRSCHQRPSKSYSSQGPTARAWILKKSKARVKLGVCFLSGLLEQGGALDRVNEKGSEMHEWREVSGGGSPSGRLIYPHVQ